MIYRFPTLLYFFSISSIVDGLVSMSMSNNSLSGTSTGSSGASEFRTSEKWSLHLSIWSASDFITSQFFFLDLCTFLQLSLFIFLVSVNNVLCSPLFAACSACFIRSSIYVLLSARTLFLTSLSLAIYLFFSIVFSLSDLVVLILSLIAFRSLTFSQASSCHPSWLCVRSESKNIFASTTNSFLHP